MVKLRSKTDEHRVSGPTWKYVCFKTWAYFIQGHLHPVPAEAAGLFLKTLDSFYPGSASSSVSVEVVGLFLKTWASFYPGSASSCVCGSCRSLSQLPPVSAEAVGLFLSFLLCLWKL